MGHIKEEYRFGPAGSLRLLLQAFLFLYFLLFPLQIPHQQEDREGDDRTNDHDEQDQIILDKIHRAIGIKR